jgi:hypothetical protein
LILKTVGVSRGWRGYKKRCGYWRPRVTGSFQSIEGSFDKAGNLGDWMVLFLQLVESLRGWRKSMDYGWLQWAVRMRSFFAPGTN